VADDQPKRVLVCVRDQAMSEFLLEAVADDGFVGEALSWTLDATPVVDAVRGRRADLLLFELWDGERAFGVLDALRAEESTARVPVVVLSTSADDAERARASYTVRETVVAPFDLEDLLAAIRRALDAPPLHADLPSDAGPPSGLAAAERLLATRSRDVLFRWVQRVRQQPSWAAHADLSLAEVLNTMPLVVEALDTALLTRDPGQFFAAHPEALDRLREHAGARRRQGIGLVDMVREYTLLRNEVWALFRRALPPQMPTADVLALEEAINLTLDRIVEATIDAYLAPGTRLPAG
jgi:CheY-like chemotaxis protein